MSVNVGDTVRVLSVPEEAVEQGIEAYGYDVSELVGTERKVVHTTQELDPFILALMGVPEDAVWVEAPGSPEGSFGLGGSEYELVAA